MKLTTPDIASEPYTAEAPPVIVCTLDRIESGTRLMSTVPKMSASGRRRPSSSTRLRFAPSAMQVDGGVAARALPAVAGAARRRELRHLIERRFERDRAALLQVFDRRDHDRARRLAVRIGDQRAGDDDFLEACFLTAARRPRPRARRRRTAPSRLRPPDRFAAPILAERFISPPMPMDLFVLCTN